MTDGGDPTPRSPPVYTSLLSTVIACGLTRDRVKFTFKLLDTQLYTISAVFKYKTPGSEPKVCRASHELSSRSIKIMERTYMWWYAWSSSVFLNFSAVRMVIGYIPSELYDISVWSGEGSRGVALGSAYIMEPDVRIEFREASIIFTICKCPASCSTVFVI